MTYVLETKINDDSEWLAWTRGSLDDVLSDFFYLRDQSDHDSLRIVWVRS